MSLFEVGRLCIKIAGRDAGRKCVVVEDSGEGYVIVDGNVRRKKVNVKHLEPLAEVIDLKGTTHADVKKAFETLGLKVWDKKSKKVSERPKKQKKVVAKKDKKVKKSEEKKEETPKAEKKVEEPSEPKNESSKEETKKENSEKK